MKILMLAVLLIATTALAEDVTSDNHIPDQEPCSLRTLKGTYLFSSSGFAVSGTDATSRTPIAQAGFETYDGRGHVRGVYTASNNGVITRSTYTATYTMEAGCTGTIVINDSNGTVAHYDLFATPGSDELVWIQTDPGTVFTGWDHRRTRVWPQSPFGR